MVMRFTMGAEALGATESVPARKEPHSYAFVGRGLRLAFRIGAWSGWERNPNAGFCGQLDELQVYRGTLTDSQIADLYAACRTSTPAAQSTEQ